MKRIIITENQINDILSQYSEADEMIFNHLRRNYSVNEIPEQFQEFAGKYTIIVDDKSIPIMNNFKRLVDKIDFDMVDKFPYVDPKERRQAIKKYLKRFV
jgi:hypothetical protein